MVCNASGFQDKCSHALGNPCSSKNRIAQASRESPRSWRPDQTHHILHRFAESFPSIPEDFQLSFIGGIVEVPEVARGGD